MSKLTTLAPEVNPDVAPPCPDCQYPLTFAWDQTERCEVCVCDHCGFATPPEDRGGVSFPDAFPECPTCCLCECALATGATNPHAACGTCEDAQFAEERLATVEEMEWLGVDPAA